jgi:hypothetical protein
MSRRWPFRNRWRGHQWVDRLGRTWMEDGAGKWWRNKLTIAELFDFAPTRRRPPKEFGPYTKATQRVHAMMITDLCEETKHVR